MGCLHSKPYVVLPWTACRSPVWPQKPARRANRGGSGYGNQGGKGGQECAAQRGRQVRGRPAGVRHGRRAALALALTGCKPSLRGPFHMTFSVRLVTKPSSFLTAVR